MLYLVIFVAGLLVGYLLAALLFKGDTIGDLCVTRDNGKDIYYMAIDEAERETIPKQHRVSFNVRIMKE